MKRVLYILLTIVITAITLTGCSSNNNENNSEVSNSNKSGANSSIPQRDIFSGTTWVYVDYEKYGFVFKEDGEYYYWHIEDEHEVVDVDESIGEIIEGGLEKYEVNGNVITFYDINMVVGENDETVKNVDFTYKISGNTLTLDGSKYNVPIVKLTRINMTPREYGLSLGINIPKVGGA